MKFFNKNNKDKDIITRLEVKIPLQIYYSTTTIIPDNSKDIEYK